MKARLKTILERFRERKILVVGDFYLDAYWLVDKTKSTLSLETPWHTNPVVEQRYSPGAAGTVANNLAALEVGEIYTLSVIGEDGFGSTLLDTLRSQRLHHRFHDYCSGSGYSDLSQTHSPRI